MELRKALLSLGIAVILIAAMTNALATKENIPIPKVAKKDVICFALYTVNNGVMKLTAQFYPLDEYDDRTARHDIKKEGKWETVATTRIITPGWIAPFRVEGWDSSKDVAYRVAYGTDAFYTGTIRKDPVDKETIVVAAFTGNSISPKDGGDIPKTDIVDNIKHINPDLLFFSGDQVYNHYQHLAAWLKFGRDFGEIIRNTPTITIPDDHDVGQPNLWGAGGKKSNTQTGDDGGYVAPVEYVQEVQRAQTSHLPDPYDPTPVERGISVYYTSMTLGRISFAIIEDRKFKTGPAGIVPKLGPRPDHVTDPNYDPSSLDVPGAKLLGDRQLEFLRHWSTDWTGADMKAVLSQTIFCGGAHLHGRRHTRILADLDSNGWPQTGRNKALREIRKGFAVMIAGDQHLGSVIRHGVDDWNDSGYSFCVPSIANLYLRWWAPLEPGRNRQPGMPEYTGEFKDGFDNKITVLAVANPSPEENLDKLTARAAGFGVIKFNKSTRKITFECWPRNVDVTDPKTRQYPGWPVTIAQQDNYGRKPVAYLPTIVVKGHKNPVIQVVNETDGDVVYTLRINGTSYQPKVFKKGTYTVYVSDGSVIRTIKNVHSIGRTDKSAITVSL